MAQWDVTTQGSIFVYDTTPGLHTYLVPVDANHFVYTYSGDATDGFVGIFEVNTTTWAVTTTSLFEIDTTLGRYASIIKVDTTHFMTAWQGAASDGYAQILQVDTSTWAVSTAAASFEYDPVQGGYQSMVLIDPNHVMVFSQETGNDGRLLVLEVNTTTWAISTVGTTLEFDTQNNVNNNAMKVDTNHALNFWVGGAGGRLLARVFSVDTSTWAVTGHSSNLDFDTASSLGTERASGAEAVDANHFIYAYRDVNGATKAQVFGVNTSTWAVTTSSSVLAISTATTASSYRGHTQLLSQIDANHYFVGYFGQDGASADSGYGQVLEVDTSTYAVTTVGGRLEYSTAGSNYNASALLPGYSRVLNLWTNIGSTDTNAQVFKIQTDVDAPASGWIPRIILIG